MLCYVQDVRAVKGMGRGWIRELCGVTKEVDERTDESVLRWFGYIERMGEI